MEEDTVLTLSPEGAPEEGDEDEVTLEEKEAEVIVDPDDPNLAISFLESEAGREELKKVSDQVTVDFDDAWEACEEYRDRNARNWRLFAGDLPPKEGQYQNMANGHIPIALRNISRLVFRAYGEIFGRDLWFAVMRMGAEDPQIARILTRHGNWQLQNQISDFKRQMHRGLLAFYHIGDVTCHSFRDVARSRNKHEILTPDDFVIPYAVTSTEPDYSDVPFKVKICNMYRHELEALEDAWADVDKVLARESPGWDSEPEALMRDAVAETSGIAKPDQSRNAPYKILQYEGWYKFKSEKRQRYIQAFVDYTTKAVLSLRIYEEEDWQDRLRFDAEVAQGQAFVQAEQTYQQGFSMVAQLRGDLDVALADPMHDPREVAIMQDALAQMPEAPPPPQPPGWMVGEDGQLNPDASPAPVRMVPIQMFSHGVCIEPLEGSLGLSHGRIQSDLNRGANVMFNQFTDQATLGNMRTMIGPQELEFVDGNPYVMPGAFNRVTGINPAIPLREQLMQLDLGAANPQLMEGVGFLSETAESSIQAPGVMSGEPGKSGETYRGLATRLEQANMQTSVSAGKYTDFFRQIAVNNAKLNRLFMNEVEFEYIVDASTQTADYVRIPRALYDRKYEVCVSTDLRFTVKSQRVSEADELIQIGSTPPLQQNVTFWWHAIKKVLEARDMHDMVKALGPEPPPPVTPLGVGAPPGGPGAPGGPPGQPGPGGPRPSPMAGLPGGPSQPGRRAQQQPPRQG